MIEFTERLQKQFIEFAIICFDRRQHEKDPLSGDFRHSSLRFQGLVVVYTLIIKIWLDRSLHYMSRSSRSLGKSP